ncbi:class I adenylate-forming enzyme family protein [Amphritea sp. HPY]|uniref:class I adenylate-forming enzyme family protein n=1 Tax=Amphritea sp. HPY TaxID=3421652 RepID=UPI003D7F138D
MTIVAQVAQANAQLTASGAPFELTEVSVRGELLPVYKHAPQSLAEVISSARRDDDDCFMVYQEQRWSFAQFYSRVDALASWFAEQGIEPGQRVAIAMRNRPEWVAAFAAVALIGAVPAPLNSFGQEHELRAALEDLQPAMLVCDSDRLKRINGDTGVNGCQILLVGECPGQIQMQIDAALTNFEEALTHPVADLPQVEIQADDPALILFTSGATSKAKAVVSTQRAVCQALYNIDYIGAQAGMTSPEAVARIMASGRAPVILTAVPLFHVSGLHAQLLSALRSGRRLVFMHRWDPKTAVEMIKAEQVTQFNGAPSMVMQLLREPGFSTPEVLEGFAGLGFGGAGLPHSLIDMVLDRLRNQMVGIGFGMTETNGVGAAASGELFRFQPRSSGVVSPLMRVRVCAADGEVLATGQTGEIQLQGATLMDGYLNNPSATADAFRDGWLCTGDLGYLDEDGFMFIVDRLKDVINRAGENIAAAEVESCLMQHSDVLEAAVYGVPDEETGEAIVAVVSVSPGEDVEEQALTAHVAANLAAYKVPSKIHILQERLPRNPAGKLLKVQLKKQFSV